MAASPGEAGDGPADADPGLLHEVREGSLVLGQVGPRADLHGVHFTVLLKVQHGADERLERGTKVLRGGGRREGKRWRKGGREGRREGKEGVKEVAREKEGYI